jgi:Ca2+-binding EF-hand superfamily protein
MRISVASLLMAGAIAWLPTQDPGQRPPRPGEDRGDQDPGGRPPRPDDFGPEDGPPPPPFPAPPNPIFLALDLDKDGEISSKELAKASTSLAKLDKNKDGIISEEEVRPARPGAGRRGPGGPGGPGGEFDGPPGGGPPGGGPGGARGADPKALVESVMKLDKNADGKISSQELPERMARMMTEGDTNKDGFLERSEVEALSKKQGTQSNRRGAPPTGGPGGGPPGGGPPGGQNNR